MAAKSKKRPETAEVNHVMPESVVPPPCPITPVPAEDEIRQLAYQKWTMAGSPEGDGIQFWLEAEQELRQ